MIYLDNGATSFYKPPAVRAAVLSAMERCANPGRGGYSAAMAAAETGHLVIATLHTKGAVNSIDRIVDAFPGIQQNQIRMQLSTVLRTVISQQLLPDVNGGMVPAYEVLQMTNAVRSMIRDNRNHQIDNTISSGNREGMFSMDQSILKLYQDGKITQETALYFADNPEQFRRRINQP